MRRLWAFVAAVAVAVAAVMVAAPTSSAPITAQHYTVEAGETYRSIAAKFGLSETALACANRTSSGACPAVTDDPGVGRIVHLTDVVPTTTTTVAATTTTVPATTTTSTTTSTVAPTTTTAPAGAFTFSASFDTAADFFGRFNTDVADYVDPSRHHTAYLFQCCPYLNPLRFTYGDHDTSCSGPNAVRQLDNADPDLSKYMYWCAPGGPATGHVMTAFDSTGYNVLSFSPAQSFSNVQQVCWDVNATEEGGGKWTNMIVVPEALYQQFAPRMDYVTSGFNAENAPGDFNIQQGDHPGTQIWGVRDFRGSQHFYIGANELLTDNTTQTTTDKMARYRHCVERTSSTTSRLTVARPDGTTTVLTLPSAIPQGPVRVIFQDEMYDAPKRAGYSDQHVTWHFDNITVSTG